VPRALGDFSAGIGGEWGLALRHDHRPQFVSEDFRDEIRFPGIEPSPAFVYVPESNGVIERLFRTLKEQLLWCHDRRHIDEVNEALQRWPERYNSDWLLERHDHKLPEEVKTQ